MDARVEPEHDVWGAGWTSASSFKPAADGGDPPAAVATVFSHDSALAGVLRWLPALRNEFAGGFRMRARIKHFLLATALSAGLAIVPGAGARAAVVQTDGSGLATSILGLAVGPDTYDIDFLSGAYADAFPGGALFANAMDITSAIAGALNASGGPLLACPAPDCTFFKIPFEIVAADLYVEVGRFLADGSANPWYDFGTEVDSIDFGDVWAVPSVSAVPLPAALPLFSAALAALGLIGRRRRKRAGIN